MLTIKSNAKEFTGFVDQLVKKQVPFALSKALNVTAVEARNGDLHQEYRSTFEERNKAFFRQVHTIRPSSAKDGKRLGRMVVAVQQSSEPRPPGTVDRLTSRQAPGVRVKYSNTHQPGIKRSVADTDFMRRHVSGGTKTPKGQFLTVPFSSANIRRRKTTGAVVSSMAPSTLLKPGGKGFIPGKKGGSGKKAVFIRRGKKKVEALYALKKSVNIKPQYKPFYAFQSGVNKRINKNFADAMQYSLKTARFRGLRFTDDG